MPLIEYNSGEGTSIAHVPPTILSKVNDFNDGLEQLGEVKNAREVKFDTNYSDNCSSDRIGISSSCDEWL